MIKKISLTFLFFCHFLYSQTLEFAVIVKDFDTDQPIDEVTITAVKSGQSFLTNKEGNCMINLSRPSDLEFLHGSYKRMVVKYTALNKKNNIVYLEPIVEQLEDYVVTREHPQEILRGLVANSRSRISLPINLKVYLREFYKQDDQIVFFNDGLINFQILGTIRNIKTDILVEQNRAIGFIEGSFYADILGYNLNNIIENYYQFKYLDEVLDAGARKKYEFYVKTFSANEDELVIKIVPLDDSKGILSSFSIRYDTKKRIILELSSSVSPERLQKYKENFFATRKVYKLEFKNTFREFDNLYYLVNSKEVIGFEKRIKKKEVRIEVKNHMVVTDLDKKLFEYSDKNIFKDKSLINKKSSFFTNYWDVASGFVATNEEKLIIDQLGKEYNEVEAESDIPSNK